MFSVTHPGGKRVHCQKMVYRNMLLGKNRLGCQISLPPFIKVFGYEGVVTIEKNYRYPS